MVGCGWRLGDQRKAEQGAKRVDVVPGTHYHSTQGTRMMESAFPGRGRVFSDYGKGPCQEDKSGGGTVASGCVRVRLRASWLWGLRRGGEGWCGGAHSGS
jgi:hypothetical protein